MHLPVLVALHVVQVKKNPNPNPLLAVQLVAQAKSNLRRRIKVSP
jgi:hypothetical protein